MLWDLELRQSVARISLHGLTCAALSPDGDAVLVGNGKGDLFFLEIIKA
jgi:hypothetical protein